MKKIAIPLLLLLAGTLQAQVVTTTEQLLKSIKPGSRITIQSGTYRLEKFKEAKNDFVSWTGGNGVTIKDVKDLHLEANGQVRLLSPEGTAAVLTFVDCEDVTIKGVIAGHTPEVQFCVGGVFSLTRCKGFKISETTLFGCGVRGLSLEVVEDVLFEKSTIKECTVDIVSGNNSNDLQFIDCSFSNNKFISTPLAFYDCKNVLFDRSVFEGNRPEDPGYGMSMFSVDEKSEVTVRSCKFRRNRATQFEDRRGSIVCEGPLFEENSFGYSPPPEVARRMASKRSYAFRSLTVHSVDELLKEIRPNEEIRLESKEFLLDFDKNYMANNPFVSLESDSCGLHLKGLHSFKLIGGEGSRIICPSPESAVVTLTDCNDCVIDGMSLGHVPLADGCFGPVLSVTKSRDILCRNAILFGCGTEGVVLESVKSFRLEDSTIEKCTSGMASLYQSSGEFWRVRMAGNKTWSGVSVSGKSSLKLFSCQIFDNALESGNLFDVDEASSLEVHTSMIVGNKANRLHRPGVDIKLEDTKLRDNEFTEK